MSAVIRFLKYLTLKCVSGNLYHLSNNCQKGPRGEHLRKVWCYERSVRGSAVSSANCYFRTLENPLTLHLQPAQILDQILCCWMISGSLERLAAALWPALKGLATLPTRSWRVTMASWLNSSYSLSIRNSCRASFNYFIVDQCSEFLSRSVKWIFR